VSSYDVVVVGSGPGGSVTARECARAGLRVLVVEEGERVEPGAVPAYSLEQMRRQYRNQGLTVALGRPPIAYTEAACAGGGSEVNSGLYHRPSAELLDAWSREHAVEALALPDVEPWLGTVEDRLQVQGRAGELPPASAVLARGAERLGWAGLDVPRWAVPGPGHPEKQTMTRTYLADALEAGAELACGSRVDRLDVHDGRVRGVVVAGRTVTSDRVVVAAGAVQSPALLQRSGVPVSGRGLAVHPTVKVVAEFAEDVNDPADLATYQVKEFAPALTLGGSASRPSLIALALSERGWSVAGEPREAWRRQQVYYAAIRSRGRGRVRSVPGFRDPVVTYRLTREDLALLRSGLARLMHLLLAAGATRLLPSYAGATTVTTNADVAPAAAAMTRSRAALMSVHLTGTLPLGERRGGVVDSWGRVRDVTNLRVNDASLLPDAPGINPQGTLMAIAHRNVDRLLRGDG
jgi:choline dehydrogenase-like flavoprotein